MHRYTIRTAGVDQDGRDVTTITSHSFDEEFDRERTKKDASHLDSYYRVCLSLRKGMCMSPSCSRSSTDVVYLVQKGIGEILNFPWCGFDSCRKEIRSSMKAGLSSLSYELARRSLDPDASTGEGGGTKFRIRRTVSPCTRCKRGCETRCGICKAPYCGRECLRLDRYDEKHLCK